MRRLKATTSACKIAASFLFWEEACGPGCGGSLGSNRKRLTSLEAIKTICDTAAIGHGSPGRQWRPRRKIMCRTCFLALNCAAALLGLLFVSPFGSAAWGQEPRLSIRGYDPVAYFTVGRPVQGKAEFEYVWRKLSWRFAT